MSGPRYLLDTNVLIGFLGGLDWAVEFLNRAVFRNADLMVSTVTRMELLGFPGMTEEEERRISELLGQLKPIAIDERVEEAAIFIRREIGLKLPDALIAATAMTRDAVLVTADTDFERVNGLRIVNPIAGDTAP